MAAPGLDDAPADDSSELNAHGHPTALDADTERAVLTTLARFEQRFGTGVVTTNLIVQVAIYCVMAQLPEVHAGIDAFSVWSKGATQNVLNTVLRQLAHVNGEGWLRSFQRRHRAKLRKVTARRPLEHYKAGKLQPEMVLVHLRNVFQAEALAQIQRRMAAGIVVDGFVRYKNIVQAEDSSDVGPPDSLLEVREVRDGDGVKKVVYVKALDEPLEHVDAKLRFALDETPITPDAPMLKTYTTTTGRAVPLSRGRASIWTLMPVLCGDGSVLSTLLLQRCLSVPVDTGKMTGGAGILVGATENAQQTDEMWLQFADQWLPLTGTAWDNPGLVFIDGHTAHVTRAFIDKCAQHGLYLVIEPSHTSLLLQVADVGVNRFVKTQYAKEYSSRVIECAVFNITFDDTQRVACLVNTVQALKKQPQLIIRCFHKVGLLCGYNDVHSLFPPSKFNNGTPLRDKRLPQVAHGTRALRHGFFYL